MSATIHPLNTARAPSLDALFALVAADMNGVNAVILERMQSNVALIPELAGHLIAGGGKRMRPMLTLACASLLGSPPPSSSSTPQPCSTTMSSTAPAFAAAAAPPTSFGEIRPAS